MAIVVTVGTINDGNKVYQTGEVITGLTDEQEQELVELGVAAITAEPKVDKAEGKGKPKAGE